LGDSTQDLGGLTLAWRVIEGIINVHDKSVVSQRQSVGNA